MESKVYLRVTIINGILIILIIGFNILVHIPGAISIDYINGEQVIQATKRFGDYFSIISLVSVLLISLSLLASLLYMFNQHKKVTKRLNKLIAAFEQSNGELIPLSEKQFKNNEIAIIEMWNKNVTELQQTTERRDEYFKRMIHDFKAPIHVIKANLKLFNLDHSVEDEYISVVAEELSILERDIENFLVVEKIDYFEKKNSIMVDLTKMLHPLLAAYTERGMQIEIINSANIERVYADQMMLRKIFENLIENAFKYSSDCAIKIEFTDQAIIFENTIDENLEICDIFSSSKRNYSQTGNGLGVSIIKKYVEINNFAIKSEKERQVFRVILARNGN